MRKDQREELRRLEEALLEPEIPDETWQAEDADSDLWLEEAYESSKAYNAYNTDTTDVDLEEFSEALQQQPRRRGCLGFVVTLLIGVLLLLIGYLLYMLGVIP